jgi:hypothetical protein
MGTIEQHIQVTLDEAGQILFPNNDLTTSLIKPHVWRDRDYVGEINGAVNAWHGYSLNLSQLDARYRVLFIDVVENALPYAERIRLFGEEFADYTASMNRFVVLLVTDFPLTALEDIRAHGFVPRLMKRAIHPCVIASEEEFMAMPAFYWAAKCVKLILLQRVLSTHRKPLDATEIPLQNILYKSGYLHQYIAKSGLAIHELSRPRKAGEFGHDFHLLVSNIAIGIADPFPIGIEVFLGAIGYHAQTIPQYISQFHLRGMVVIAKDNPFPDLLKANATFNIPLKKLPLRQMGMLADVGLHHLPLDQVILDLSSLKNELEDLLTL